MAIAKGFEAASPPVATCVRLELLGGFRLDVDDVAVHLPRGLQRLLALLALHDTPVRRVHVAAALWPDADEESGHARLRSMLWRLRRLSAALVQTRGAELRFGAGARVDVRELAARARSLQREPTTPDDVAVADLGLDGDLLPDWDDDWLLIERERVRQLRLRVLETLAQRLIDDGRAAEAVDLALTAIAVEPLRESSHRVLIAAFLAMGNQVDAVRQYHSFSRMLRDSVGLRPTESMEQVIAPLARG